METGMAAVFSMSFMRWIKIRNIWVTPQNAESPRMERRTMGWLQVAENSRTGERIFRESWDSPTRMQKAATVVTTESPR